MTPKIESATIHAGNVSMLYGGLTGFLGWLAQINWIGLAGATAAIGGLLVSAYFQWRKNRRQERESEERRELERAAERRAEEIHALTLQKLRGECET